MPREVTVAELAETRTAGNPVFLLDIREDWERQAAKIADELHIPMNDIPGRATEIKPPAGAMLVVYCHTGKRSLMVAGWLEKNGFPGALSLAGGIDAWSQEIDPTVPQY